MEDLIKFRKIFGQGFEKKIADDRIEFRIKGDLDSALKNARELIIKNNLKLVAKTSGSMSGYGAFEVTIMPK